MRRLLILPLLLVAGGCAALTPPAGLPSPDQCGAAGAQSLIGSHAGAVTFPAGKPVRLVCTTCPTTRDYRPDRLNIRFEQATGIIRSVICG
jgi:hypothetical protein